MLNPDQVSLSVKSIGLVILCLLLFFVDLFVYIFTADGKQDNKKNGNAESSEFL